MFKKLLIATCCLFVVFTKCKSNQLYNDFIDKNDDISTFNKFLPFIQSDFPKFTKEFLRQHALNSFYDLDKEVKFYLYTNDDPNNGQLIVTDDVKSLKESNWRADWPTKIYVHGFSGNSTIPQMEAMKAAFLSRKDYINIIAMDWGPMANRFYPIAAHYSEEVGKVGSRFVDFLCEYGGARPGDFHIVGLSLGAHVAGFLGNHVKSGRVGRVTGLDAATFGFITVGKNSRLDKSDADFVDCIHTAGRLIGFMEPLCHADFYVNGGLHPQPGCPNSLYGIGCSHVRSQDLFTESIEIGHKFPAFICDILSKTGPESCSNNDEGILMGYPAEEKYHGIFYAKTSFEYPFGVLTNND